MFFFSLDVVSFFSVLIFFLLATSDCAMAVDKSFNWWTLEAKIYIKVTTSIVFINYLTDCDDPIIFQDIRNIKTASNQGTQKIFKGWQCSSFNSSGFHFSQGPMKKIFIVTWQKHSLINDQLKSLCSLLIKISVHSAILAY